MYSYQDLILLKTFIAKLVKTPHSGAWLGSHFSGKTFPRRAGNWALWKAIKERSWPNYSNWRGTPTLNTLWMPSLFWHWAVLFKSLPWQLFFRCASISIRALIVTDCLMTNSRKNSVWLFDLAADSNFFQSNPTAFQSQKSCCCCSGLSWRISEDF